ncbi:YbcN family protein [Rahnella sp. PAMC 25559]|uniref:YbcN family protein n=1 Tax=Rahnella sp. PAMC 25559 TaxID=3423225 RepID=UPI003D67BE03
MDDFCLHETTKAQLWPVLKELVASGKRYRVSIKEWHDKRSVSQNALLWKWNGEIAGQLVKAEKGTFTGEQLHEYLKEIYCPAKAITVMGETRYVKSTKLLDTGEMTIYLDQLNTWARQRGIRLTIPDRCEYQQLRTQQGA